MNIILEILWMMFWGALPIAIVMAVVVLMSEMYEAWMESH